MNVARRDFVRLTVAAVAAVAVPATATAQRMRILGGSPEQAPPATSAGPSVDLQRVVSTLRIGDPVSQGPLVVFWLSRDSVQDLEIATLEEAQSRGVLTITERDQATVPQLIVENRGKVPVLLLAGEILLGGKQNRVLAEDILLPPLSGPRNVGVYCVEQGRWVGQTSRFETKGTFAASALRSRLMEKSSQDRVWAEVERHAASVHAASPTGNYQAIFEQRAVKQHVERVEHTFDPPAGALGAAAFLRERLAGLDLFDGARLFAREWPKLLRAYAVDFYATPDTGTPDTRPLRARVDELVRGITDARGVARSNAGVGTIFEFRVGHARGAALIFDGHVIHAAVI